jgi:hypothetical protein
VADLAVRTQIVGPDQVAGSISLRSTNSSISMVLVDSSATLELILSHLDVGVRVDLEALDDVLVVDLLPRVRVDLGVLDAVARLPVQLVEGDLFGLRGGRIQHNGQVTRERRKKPFQLAREAMAGNSGY